MKATAETLDKTFHALANPTRRAVIGRLGRGPATVSELADPFDMALPSFLQHMRVLEETGLVQSRKSGRVRTYSVRSKQLKRAADWLVKQQQIWEQRLDQLDTFVKGMENKTDDSNARD